MEVWGNIGEVGEEDAVDAVRKWETRDGQRWEKVYYDYGCYNDYYQYYCCY